MAITVKLNLPKDEVMAEFQDRLCFAVAKVIKDTKPREYIRDLQKQLKLEEEE